MTLRAHIYIVNVLKMACWLGLAASLPGLSACSHSKPVTIPASSTDGTKLETLDVAGRGRPDTWRWITTTKEGLALVVREEKDLNRDQRVDLWKELPAGKLAKVIMDLDFDGRPDLVEIYENDVLIKAETSHSFSGKTDTWKFFEKGLLARVERDSNEDGKPDEFWYYEQGKLKRVGRDYDFDGVVDTWEE